MLLVTLCIIDSTAIIKFQVIIHAKSICYYSGRPRKPRSAQRRYRVFQKQRELLLYQGVFTHDFYIAKKISQNIGQLRRSDWCCENGYLKLENHVNNNNNTWGERVQKMSHLLFAQPPSAHIN